MKFLICTNNKHKLKELSRILFELGIGAVSPKDAGIDLSSVEETGETFAENAKIKAEAGLILSGLPAIADDSGLCVDALSGRPGVYSARYGGENATDQDRINKLLDELKEVEEEQRTARFICAICAVFPNKDVIIAEGRCEGRIAMKQKGTNGFGYDPVFSVKDKKTFAQLPDNEKDTLSHRGQALKNFKCELKKYMCEIG